MSDLLKLDQKLDETRIALNINMRAYDDDLKETFDQFKELARETVLLIETILKENEQGVVKWEIQVIISL